MNSKNTEYYINSNVINFQYYFSLKSLVNLGIQVSGNTNLRVKNIGKKLQKITLKRPIQPLEKTKRIT